ncbi:MAG: hypothetical protein P1U36_10100 [Legionellaceae bacterium]|nr:hypothetical protein [Legionellaceae bacterium]
MINLNGDEKNRVKIPSNFFYDERLSFAAKGMLSYLLTQEKDDLNALDLMDRSTNGRDSTRTILKELVKLGYLLREPIRDSDGKISGLRNYIFPDGRKCVDEVD